MHCTAQYTIQMEIVAFRTFSEIIKYGKDTTTVDMIKSEIFVLHFYRLNANQPLKLIGWFERKANRRLYWKSHERVWIWALGLNLHIIWNILAKRDFNFKFAFYPMMTKFKLTIQKSQADRYRFRWECILFEKKWR